MVAVSCISHNRNRIRTVSAGSEHPVSFLYFIVVWAFLFFAGCAAGPLRDARNAFYSNRPLDAVSALSDAKPFSRQDSLLVSMEKGLILHHLGRYEESVREFLKASKQMALQDIIRVGEQTLSLVTTDWVTEYKGEYSEQLWVHTYLMMNFLILRKHDSALVEAKKALKVLEKHPKPLSGDYFTRSLIALCYENVGEINDAYIEYRKLAKLMRDPSPVASPLYRLGMRLGFSDEVRQYKKFIPKSTLSLLADRSSAELILFVGLGTGPVKVSDNIVAPPSIRLSFPSYSERSTGSAEVTVLDSSRRLPASVVTTDMNAVARSSLKDRARKIIAKETARAAIKEAMARAVERKNDEIVGILLRAALFLMEEADTRCWQTLPASLKLLRVPVSRACNIKVVIRSPGGVDEITLPDLKVYPGQRVYRSLRVNY